MSQFVQELGHRTRGVVGPLIDAGADPNARTLQLKAVCRASNVDHNLGFDGGARDGVFGQRVKISVKRDAGSREEEAEEVVGSIPYSW